MSRRGELVNMQDWLRRKRMSRLPGPKITLDELFHEMDAILGEAKNQGSSQDGSVPSCKAESTSPDIPNSDSDHRN